MDKDKMLKRMCGFELNQADIKAICKLRALPPACLQSRTLLQHNFLSDTGIEKAVAALDPREVLCLHLLNAAGREEDISFFTARIAIRFLISFQGPSLRLKNREIRIHNK